VSSLYWDRFQTPSNGTYLNYDGSCCQVINQCDATATWHDNIHLYNKDLSNGGSFQSCTMYPAGGGEIMQATEGLCQNGQPPMMAATFNGLAYNPLITYEPPKRGNASADKFPNFDNTGGNLWNNVTWKNPSGTPAWNPAQGSPVNVDLTTQRCYYTTAQYNALANDYLRGAFTGWQSQVGFQPATVSGVSAYSVPVHYYRTNVKWCKTTRTSTVFNNFANPGTIQLTSSSGGVVTMTNCQDGYDQAAGYIYPYYYSPSGENNASAANNQTTPAFDLVVFDLSNTSSPKINIVQNGVASTGLTQISHSYYDAVTGTMKTKVRSAKDEVTNYANWAAYYRNRVSATKTSASVAFADAVPDGAGGAGCNPTPPRVFPRVGFTTISPRSSAPYTQTVSVDDFCSNTKREDFTNKLLAYTALSDTPLRETLKDIGDQFVNDSNNKLVKYACQRSNVIMFTDGLWNGANLGMTANYDGVTLATALPVLDLGNPLTSTPPTPAAGTMVYSTYGGGPLPAIGQHWPDPIRDYKNTSATNITLADLALYYWMTPLGGASKDNSVPEPKPLIKNTRSVAPTARDPATWPHLNFYGMGFGVRGTLPLSDQTATLSQMGSGVSPKIYTWPKPAANDITTVDDLWHASINGFGMFVAAQSTEEFSTGLKKILAEILNTGGASSGVGFTSTNLTVGDQYTYTPSFAPGWNGNIIKKKIDNIGQEQTDNQMSAAINLIDLLKPTGTPPNMPWKDVRQVFTTVWSGGSVGAGTGAAVPFTASDLSGAMLGTLGATLVQQTNVIAYLRGDRSNEGDALGKFRVRGVGPLGDIVNAKPVAVTKPYCDVIKNKQLDCSYDEALNPGYQQFYWDQEKRGTMVYAAANDGMLHAFDGDLKEKWAYIPSDLFRPQNQAGVVNLTYQEGDLNTPFKHYYYVDATPRVLDVDFESRGLGDDGNLVLPRRWRTVLVGGLGKGGTSYYALNVTDAGALATQAATASSKAMWEFTDGNMGYTYGRAILIKTKATDWGYKSDNDPGGKWVAILPSGYNNGFGNGQLKHGDGKGYLFFVDVDTGVLLHTVSTPDGFGSPDTPLGIVAIGGYIENPLNQLTTAIYAGDQQGNLWRFRLEDTNKDNWKAERMAILRDKNGNKQWVTTEPWQYLDENNNRWVFVGTGGFRNDDDLTSITPTNTFYAFRDGIKGGADTFTDRSRNDLAPVSGVNPIADNDKGKLENNGWYEDMDTHFHLDVNPTASFGIVVYAANKFVGGLPAGQGGNAGMDPCTSAMFTGRIYARYIQRTEPIYKEKGYVEDDDGFADVEIILRGAPGSEEIAIAATSRTGKGLRPPLTLLKGSGGGNVSRVPVRTSLRYINN
jgi:type IV pilus assembly protein PilY1